MIRRWNGKPSIVQSSVVAETWDPAFPALPHYHLTTSVPQANTLHRTQWSSCFSSEERGTCFQLYPNVECDSSHRFLTKSQTDGVFYPGASEYWLSSPQRCVLCLGKWQGNEARETGKINEPNHHLKPNEVSSRVATHCSYFRKNLVTNPPEGEMWVVICNHSAPSFGICAHSSPVRLKNVNDPNIKQQPFPFTIAGRDATHTVPEDKKKRVRKSLAWHTGLLLTSSQIRTGNWDLNITVPSPINWGRETSSIPKNHSGVRITTSLPPSFTHLPPPTLIPPKRI